MEFRQNQGGEGGRAEADRAIKVGVQKGAYRFQEKKGSVFPVKKKLVKTMMAECIANSLSSKNGGSFNRTVTNTTPSNSEEIDVNLGLQSEIVGGYVAVAVGVQVAT
ncbi:hypothetical protein Gogos_008603, partial [Gossypium gossypioides]|nr:hypothetical protein [Gossypium gossypioides]